MPIRNYYQRQYVCQRQRRHRHATLTLASLPLIIIGVILLSLLNVRQGAEVTAFVQTSSISRLKTFSSNKDLIKRANNDNISSSTQRAPSLSMVTKSGGRLIASIEQFDQEVLKNESSDNEPPLDPKLPVLVLFSAPWCGPCRLTNPVVKEIMKQYQNKIEVVEISTDDLPEVASDAGVLSIPTIQLYYEGKVLDTIVGCVAKNVLARSVDKVLEDLGMLDDQV
jgi:thioredoxin 1